MARRNRLRGLSAFLGIGSKFGAVIGRRYAKMPFEGTAQPLFVAKSGQNRNSCHGMRTALQEALCGVNTNDLDRFGRCAARSLLIPARKASRAHCDTLGQRIDAQITLEIAGDPGMEVREGPVLVLFLGDQHIAELGLAAGALEEHDQCLCHLHRGGVPKIFLDHRKGQIDPRCHPGRGPHLSVTDEEWIPFDADVRVAILQFFDVAPVCGDHLPLEQTGLRG